MLATLVLAGASQDSQGVAPDNRFVVNAYCESGLAAVWDELVAARVPKSLRLDNRTRSAAAVMHAHAVEALWRREPSLEPPSPHYQIARDLARGIQEPQLSRGWTLAVSYVLMAHLAFPLADNLLLEARQRFPTDAEILVAAGSLQEVYTQPIGRQFLRLKGDWGDRLRSDKRVRAVALYRQALTADPKQAEAHLRLGRVALVAGDRYEARMRLEWVLANAAHPWLTYLAHLFLGELAEQEGLYSSAEGHYEQATHLWPGAQTAALALAALRVRSGSGSGTLRLLGPRFDGTHGPVHRDPWLDYEFANSDRAHAALEALRRRACQ